MLQSSTLRTCVSQTCALRCSEMTQYQRPNRQANEVCCEYVGHQDVAMAV